MQEYTTHKPSTFCWLDLGTSDTTGAKKFYSNLFGWEPVDVPAGEGMTYTMLNINDKAVAALYELSAEQKSQNIPPYWMTYVAVEDAAATMLTAKENGATIIMDTFDVMGEGLMGTFQAPDGAFLCIWQAKAHIGVAYKNIPGTLCWVELGCRDSNLAIPFYEKVFGWKGITQKMGETDYTTFMLGEEMAAGMYIMPPDMANVPSHWLAYFLIESIDASLEKASAGGAAIIMPKTFVQGVGHFAVLQDPQGAVFGLIQGE